MESIIVAIITGGLSLAGVIISNVSSNRKVQGMIETKQAVTDTKLEELTREVHLHNNFAQRLPVVEEKIENLDKRITKLETK